MSELVEVKKYLERSTADLDKSFLESCDLHPVVMSDDLGGLRPHMTYGYSVRLMVPREELEEADKLLHAPSDSESIKIEEQYSEQKDPTQIVASKSSEAVQMLDRSWKVAILSLIILPFIGNLYSIYLLKTSIPKLTEEEWNNNSRPKVVWAMATNLLAFYFFYKVLT